MVDTPPRFSRGGQQQIIEKFRSAQADAFRLYRTAEDQLTDNTNIRDQIANRRANEIEEQRDELLRANALRQRQAIQRATDTHRANEIQSLQALIALTRASLLCLAFEYESDMNYSLHSEIVIRRYGQRMPILRCIEIQGRIGRFLLRVLKGAESNKKVSSVNFYAEWLLIRANEDNSLIPLAVSSIHRSHCKFSMKKTSDDVRHFNPDVLLEKDNPPCHCKGSHQEIIAELRSA
ncbi:hypothetical protein CDAR_97011 [Caerostris darwini]|uniref:Uncharacterized protein n=1 Tax=Caerostris darwini TaxID=1538125 RepID=A0AAV4QN02_9ARAC|nr:uncharacterized protein CDAR_275971 [Caerostris darwini]GIY10677.1 hypothetical protein CDAR_97011 [Caerostris darwini]